MPIDKFTVRNKIMDLISESAEFATTTELIAASDNYITIEYATKSFKITIEETPTAKISKPRKKKGKK